MRKIAAAALVLVPILILLGRPRVPLPPRQGTPPAETAVPSAARPTAVPPIEPASAGPRHLAGSKKPYPYRRPEEGRSEAWKRTTDALAGRRLSIDAVLSAPEDLLSFLWGETGLHFRWDPDPETEWHQSRILVTDVSVNTLLRLVLCPQELDFAVQEDGSVQVTTGKRLRPLREEESLAARTQADLHQARELLDRGWNGAVDPRPWQSPEPARPLPTVGVDAAFAGTAVEEALQSLSAQAGAEVQIDPRIASGHPTVDLSMTGPFSEVLATLARDLEARISVTETGGIRLVPGPDPAAEEASRAFWEDCRRRLDRACPIAGCATLDDLAAAVEAACGWRLVPSPEVWWAGLEAPSALSGSVRDILDGLCRSSGLRWAVGRGTILLLR